MPGTSRVRRSYHPSLRQMVHDGEADELVRALKIPRSTVSSWKRTTPPEVVAAGNHDDMPKLRDEVARLRRRVRILTATITLLLAIIRVAKFRLDQRRLADGSDKAEILRAIERTRTALPLRAVLRILRLSQSRYSAWKKAEQSCQLDDALSCPRSHPTQLTPDEVRTMRDMVTSPEYRHVSTGILAVLAQRLGRVFASAATWCRYVRERGWRRPRRRVHPSPPKVGVRVDAPDKLWHLDTTIIRLVDEKKVYLRVVIDNFSRRILSWWLGSSPEPTATAALLLKAHTNRQVSEAGVPSPQPVMVDGGIENFNEAVDQLVRDGILKRILAQTDIVESNSMVEAVFRRLKNQWLYLNEFDTIESVRRLIAFYVNEYNSALPHSAHGERTPDEAYFGAEEDLPAKLAATRQEARRLRMEKNRQTMCETCLA